MKGLGAEVGAGTGAEVNLPQAIELLDHIPHSAMEPNVEPRMSIRRPNNEELCNTMRFNVLHNQTENVYFLKLAGFEPAVLKQIDSNTQRFPLHIFYRHPLQNTKMVDSCFCS